MKNKIYDENFTKFKPYKFLSLSKELNEKYIVYYQKFVPKYSSTQFS